MMRSVKTVNSHVLLAPGWCAHLNCARASARVTTQDRPVTAIPVATRAHAFDAWSETIKTARELTSTSCEMSERVESAMVPYSGSAAAHRRCTAARKEVCDQFVADLVEEGLEVVGCRFECTRLEGTQASHLVPRAAHALLELLEDALSFCF